jgi:hypothetical protein
MIAAPMEQVERMSVEKEPSLVRSDLEIQHGLPKGQPEYVHQLTEALFAPYEIEDGCVRLAGCRLEEHPVFALQEAGDDNWEFFDEHGQPVLPELIEALHLRTPVALATPPPSIRPSAVSNWVKQALTGPAADCLAALNNPILHVVWCFQAQGKLTVESGEESATFPFQGWALQVSQGDWQPPMFRCAYSGLESYRVTRTDRGQLTVPEAVGTCAASGTRCLALELKRCVSSGELVLPEYLQKCPATGEQVQVTEMLPCQQCKQSVSRRSLNRGFCSICRELVSIEIESTEWNQAIRDSLAGVHYGHWSMGQGERFVVFKGTSWRGRVLIVFDRRTGDVLGLRKKTWWSKDWSS